jgi:hypothetical protein
MALLSLEGVEQGAAFGLSGLQLSAVLPRNQDAGNQADGEGEEMSNHFEEGAM